MVQSIKHLIRRNKGDGKIITIANGRNKTLIKIPNKGKQSRQSTTILTKSDFAKTIKEVHRVARIRDNDLQSFDNITFAEYAVRFLARKRDNIKISTYTIYETILKKHAMPHLGHIPMK